MSRYTLHLGDCLEALRGMPDNSIDSIVTDPPYGLSFMGKRWDYDVPATEVWAECLRVLKPGGHLLAFAGTRTQHRMAVRIEDGGFEIRDMIAWVYGSGFPKSLDVSKAIDKAGRRDYVVAAVNLGLEIPGNNLHDWTKAEHSPGDKWWEEFKRVLTPEQWGAIERAVTGKDNKGRAIFGSCDGEYEITAAATDAARQWQGWGTALKPALEPITVARKPLVGTVAANVLAHGTGALNIDGCRVGTEIVSTHSRGANGAFPKRPGETSAEESGRKKDQRDGLDHSERTGRWPANLIHDGSDEPVELLGDAARFFYCAKASRNDRNEGLSSGNVPAVGTGSAMREREDSEWSKRNGNHHPTVKPTDLMAYLCRLVTPPGGIVLDPFMGSGSTGKAAIREGFGFIGCELSPEYMAIAEARIKHELDCEEKQTDLFS